MKIVARFLGAQTNRHVIINILGNTLNVFFVALYVFLLARILSKEDYGVLTVLLNITYVLANILELGTNATIFAHIPSYLARNREQIHRFIKSIFIYQTVLGTVLIATIGVSLPHADAHFLHTNTATINLFLAAGISIFLIWQNFVMNCMFAAKKVLHANIFLNVANMVRTLTIFLIWWMDIINITYILMAFGLSGPITFFLLVFRYNTNTVTQFMHASFKRADIQLKYMGTYFFGWQFFNLGVRTDTFVMSHLTSKSLLGEYGVAQKIVLTLMSLIISVTQILSPRFAHVTNRTQARKEIRHAYAYLLLPIAGFALLWIVPDWVYIAFFTEKYRNVAHVARLLSIPYIIFTLGQPAFLFLLYTKRKPMYLLVAYALFLGIVGIGSYLLIPMHALQGPVYALITGFTISTSILILGAWREYRTYTGEKGAAGES